MITQDDDMLYTRKDAAMYDGCDEYLLNQGRRWHVKGIRHKWTVFNAILVICEWAVVYSSILITLFLDSARRGQLKDEARLEMNVKHEWDSTSIVERESSYLLTRILTNN